MQEPVRLNLLNVLQRNLKQVDKKTYIHRLIYIGDYLGSTQQDSRFIQLIFESNINLINEEFSDVPLTGFGLFYNGYFINIVESSEECIVKHLKTLFDSLSERVTTSPVLNRMRILVGTHHVIKRNFMSWFGRPARPPVLLDKIEASNPDDINRQIHICIKKLYRMSEYLRNQPPELIRATMDNISDVCQQYLPEVNLLDFLLDSPALLTVMEAITTLGTVPEPKFIEDLVWPIPTDFVPYNIVGGERSKVLMYSPKDEEVESVHEEPPPVVPEERPAPETAAIFQSPSSAETQTGSLPRDTPETSTVPEPSPNPEPTEPPFPPPPSEDQNEPPAVSTEITDPSSRNNLLS